MKIRILILSIILLICFLPVSNVSALSVSDGEIIAQRAALILPESMIWTGVQKECFSTNLGTVVCFNREIMQDLSQCVRTTIGGIVVCVDECGGLSVPGQVCTKE